MSGRRCTVCAFPQVNEVDRLLASGTSARKVARLYGLARTTVGRHRAHVAPTSRKFAVIETTDGPSGPGDPLAEAFLLAEKARTPRERLRALEQIRAATKLALRGRAGVDGEDAGLLDSNIAAAEAAFRDAPDFETAARALSGWREALLQRLDAAGRPEPIKVPIRLTFDDGSSADAPWIGDAPPTVIDVAPELYWKGVPQRLRDSTRYEVVRDIRLRLDRGDPLPDGVKVYDASTGALVWSK